MGHRVVLIDRDRQIGAVSKILRSAGSSAQTLLISGPAGVGKTAVLQQARLAATQDGVKVITMNWHDTEEPPGAAAAADAVCDILARIHDGWLPARITAVRRVQWRITHPGGESLLLKTMSDVLADAAQSVPFAVILDDLQWMPSRTASALGVVLRAFRPTDVPVVIASRPTSLGKPLGADLAATADQVLQLQPLSPSGTDELAARWAGCPIEPTLLTALLRALGPLAGNPEAVLSLLTSWREGGSLLELGGRLCLAMDHLNPVGRPADLLRLLQPSLATESVELAAILAHLTEAADLRLDDLRFVAPDDAARTESIAATVDQFVSDQVLSVDDDRRLSFPVPALAAALRTLPVQDDLASIHARIVTEATGRMDARSAGARYPYLADHAAAAGPMLSECVAVPLILAGARNDDRLYPRRISRAYRAALHRLSLSDPQVPSLLREAAEFSIRYGDYEALLKLGQPLLASMDRLTDRAAVQNRPTGHETALQFAVDSWALAALHEHRVADCHLAVGSDHHGSKSIQAEVRGASLASLYGIGPGIPAAWYGDQKPPSTIACDDGLQPAPAEWRLIAAAVGSKPEFDSAQSALSSCALDKEGVDQLRNAAAYGDLASAFAAVLGERYPSAGHSTAIRYRAMVRDYLRGRWDSALSIARQIEIRSRSDGMPGPAQLGRALAAEIHCMRGELGHARAWLDLIPDTLNHPLIDRTRIAVQYWLGEKDQAMAGGWHDVRRARKSGLLVGVDRVLLRILAVAAQENDQETTLQALKEIEALHEETASPMTREAVLIARGIVHRHADSLLAAHRSIMQRADAPLNLLCCYALLEISDDPRPWLTEVKQLSHSMAIGRPIRAVIDGVAQRRNVSLPRRRSVAKELSKEDVKLIEMVSSGATNGQIAARLACSEKTVEHRLTRLFRRTGCPSRVKLAAAWLDGTLARLGLVPVTDSGQRGHVRW
ncbi:LuxR family transcriptional regulator [Streptomyces sp. NPDC048663]|uniref:LuxR family transcriptional regulator n=1 Tax=Streptomyces sp. NPDC048663 TaxID=3155638 RepID=UPI00343F8AE6